MNILLALHNLNRWIVLILIVLVILRAALGLFQNRKWASLDRRLSLFATIALDVQLLMGLILYFTSPITRQAFQDFGAAMGADLLRQFALEHPFYSILAIAAAHIGSTRARKAQDAGTKYRTLAIFFILVLILLVLGIPWGRPLLPAF